MGKLDPQLTTKQAKALKAWLKWYSAKLDRINADLSGRKKPQEDYSGYEQDLFEAFYCDPDPVLEGEGTE